MVETKSGTDNYTRLGLGLPVDGKTGLRLILVEEIRIILKMIWKKILELGLELK